MKKLARVVGVMGGLLALLWAMRDRIISIAAPREPEPPRFRVVPPSTAQPPPSEDDELLAINGIGPVFAARLRGAGIDGRSELAGADAERVAEVAGVPVTRAQDWIQQASGLHT